MKLYIWMAVLLLASVCEAQYAKSNSSVKILDAATATGAGSTFNYNGPYGTFQCYGTTSAGAGAATITVEVSNVTSPAAATSVDWITAGTISLTLGTTQTTDGFAVQSSWRWARVKVTAISGTNGTVSCFMGKPG